MWIFCQEGFPGVYHHNVSASLMGLLDSHEIEGRTMGCWIFSPDDNKVSIFNVREHVDIHTPHRNMGSYHGKRHVTEGAHAEGVR